MEELARRAVACKGWRWMPGMLIEANGYVDRVCIAWEDGMLECRDYEIIGDDTKDVLPDLTDPATLGCLLALVRQAYGFRLWLAASRDGDMWYVDAASGALAHGNTEAEALVTALEAVNV